MPRRHRGGPTARAALVAIVLVAAACGSGAPDGPGTTVPAGRHSTTPAPGAEAGGQAGTTAQDEAARAAVSPSRERLSRAGYAVAQTRVDGVQPPPAGALETALHGGGQLTLFVYTSPADARRRAAAFASLRRRHPHQVAIAVRDTRVYLGTVDLPRRLSRRAFLHAVATAEGSAATGR